MLGGMNTSLRILAPLAGTALILAACSTAPPAAPSGANESPAAPTQTAPQSEMPKAEAPAPTTTPQSTPAPTSPGTDNRMLAEAGVAAVSAALAAQPGTVVGLDNGLDDNGEWEVDILPDGANKAVEVRVLNGQVTGTQPDTDDDDMLSIEGMTVPVEAAITKAFTMLQGTFDSADLEMLNGTPVWLIDIDPAGQDDDQKVQINAVTGEAVLVAD